MKRRKITLKNLVRESFILTVLMLVAVAQKKFPDLYALLACGVLVSITMCLGAFIVSNDTPKEKDLTK